ncbi:MAG: sugar phosphate nucleotidyltransferase [Lentisphaerota bacterium]
MQVVILAGGMGTRIKSVAGNLPKILLPVAGRPFLEHQLELLAKHGLRDVVYCVGYGGDQVEQLAGDGSRYGFTLRYAQEDPACLMGTGGALLNALPLLQSSFLVLYGDSYLPTDYRRLVHAFQAGGRRAMMSVFKNEGQWDKSNVRIADGRVVFYSKSAGPGEADYIDYGLSAFRKEVIESYRSAALPLDMARIQQDLVNRGEMAAYEVKERFYEIGKPEGLNELSEWLSRKGRG